MQYQGGNNPNAYGACDTTFTELYNYGTAGAPTGKQLVVSRGGGSFALAATYTYDGEGRTTAETYPTDNSGNTANLSYTFDSMGRLNTMTDNIANRQIIQGATYGPANETLSITGGSYSGAWAGETRTYNSLKQLTQVQEPGAVNISYNYPSTGNNGKIISQTDGISGETVTYTYDALNRLSTAENQSTFSPSWGQSFSYDGFGNLTNTNVIQGSAPSMAATYDANNHAGGEDANGNPGYIQVPALGSSVAGVYDVENRLAMLNSGCTVMCYSYDPANKRVWRGSWNYNGEGAWTRATDEVTFWSVSGRKLGTYNVTQSGSTLYCTQSGTNLYFGAKLIKNNNGWVYSDRLGSIGKFYPYGIERPSATTNGTEKFTGYFRDSETGNDYADQRYESPGAGRFVTPDRMSGTPVDPSSWNKYAYTRGDPVNRVDRQGTDDEGDDGDGYYDSTPLFDDEGIANGEATNPQCALLAQNAAGGNPEAAALYATYCGGGEGLQATAGSAQVVNAPGRGLGPDDFNAAALSMIDGGILLRTSLLANGVSPACQNDLTAVGVNANQIMAGALSLAGNIYDGWGSAENYGDTIYANSPALNANAGPQTIGGYFATHGGTVALSQSPGNGIWIDPTFVTAMSPIDVEGLVFHELLHNITGQVDTVIQQELFGMNSPQVGQASVNIANQLEADCLPNP